MKKIFTFLIALGTALLSNAQHQNPNGTNDRLVTPNNESSSALRNSEDAGSLNLQEAAGRNRGGGSFVFSEDFSNGFAGDTPYGAWTPEDSGGNTIWMMADATSPNGDWQTGIPALASPTAANGWVIFDADAYQVAQGHVVVGGVAPSDYEDVTGYLTSPVIDMSTLGSVLLEFNQYYRYCCLSSKPVFVEVTNNGGINWVVFDASPGTPAATNTLTANPLNTVIDISGVAAGQSSVQFRFGWQPNDGDAHSHYFWGLDDVSVYENPVQNDIRVSYVSNGNMNTEFEYRAIPVEQADENGMVVGAIYANAGAVAQDVTFLAEILDSDMETLASETTTTYVLNNAGLIDPTEQIDTLYLNTGWVPEETGTYYARMTVSLAGADEVPADNVMMKKFYVTTDEYGHDDPALILPSTGTNEMNPPSGDGSASNPFPSTGYGSYVKMYNPGSVAHGITVRFDNETTTGTVFSTLLLQHNENYNLDDANFISGDEFVVDNAWTPNASGSIPTYLPFSDAQELDVDADSLFFFGVQTLDEGSDLFSVQAIPEVDRDFSTGVWAETTTETFIWFFGLDDLNNFTPAIRLILSDRVGVEEQESAGLDAFTLSPNPASTNVRVNFALKGSRYVAYEVRDVTGKLMEWKNIGQYAPGENSFTLNVSAYPAGNYFVNLVIDGEKLFTQQMNVTK